MRISATINESEFKKTLRQWSKLTGKGVEQGITTMARTSAKNLAHTVHPWGLSSAVGNKFRKSIARQVSQVWFGVNLGVYDWLGTLAATHESLRKHGKIRFRQMRGRKKKRWLYLSSEHERDQLIDQKTDNAGLAKGGWIHAAHTAGGRNFRWTGKTAEIGAWIAIHAYDKTGGAKWTGRGLDAEIELHNKVTYIKYLQKSSDIYDALKRARTNTLSYMRRAIRHQLRKAQQ